MKTFSKAQNLMFELMKIASFNSFDGEQVVADLKENASHFKGAIFTRLYHCPLIVLRDINIEYNADTLYLLVEKKEDIDFWADFIEKWNVDEFGWAGGEETDGAIDRSVSQYGEKTRYMNWDLGISPPREQDYVIRIWWD